MGWGSALLVVIALCAIWPSVNPQGMWWTLSAWRYRDPDANEPSDELYFVYRTGAVVSLVASSALGIVLLLNSAIY